ncbi:MAG: mandelate racemase/muconate lactonizing enzyme family protein [Streptosporangiales bacterium]|nr:mandelate racemase/muconate lactonizing enzyme family protein [Streptosporangiales bacterium]
MIIDRVDTVRVGEFPNLLFVQVFTDDGLVGLGETFYGAAAVATHIHDAVAPKLLGEDSRQIEHLNGALAGYVGFAGTGVETRARSAVDIALWDLLGNASGLPVHDLLGGRTRERIRLYNTCAGTRYIRQHTGQNVANWGVEEQPTGPYEDLYAFLHDAGKLATDLLSSGINGMKIWPFDPYAEASRGTHLSPDELRRATEPFRLIRDAVGDAMDVMVELHGLWNVPAAQRIAAALQPYQPSWLEDPVRADLVDGLAAVSRRTDIPIAAGETLAGRAAFLPLLAEQALGVVTVDLTWTGGLTEARKIATLADTYGVPVAPHDCTGPVALTACTHLSTSAPNALVQEFVRAAYYGWYGDLVTALPTVADGTIAPPQGAGLGTALRPDLDDRQDVERRTTTRD